MSGWKPSSSLTITKDFALFVTNPLKIYTYLHFQNSIFQKTRHPFRTEKQKLRQKWAKTTFYFAFSYYIMMPGSKGLSPQDVYKRQLSNSVPRIVKSLFSVFSTFSMLSDTVAFSGSHSRIWQLATICEIIFLYFL